MRKPAYPAEFKTEAVSLYRTSGRSLKEIATDLGVSTNILLAWSQKMLTQTLRELERNGLVKRTAYPVVPPHTEYELTDLGVSLEDIIYRLGGWAQENIRAVLEARQAYDRRSA